MRRLRREALLVVTMTVFVALLTGVGVAAPSSPAKCTIVGTKGSDELRGTSKRDVICGLGGDDTIAGARGGDLIRGGSGNDVVKAGPGADAAYGGSGSDLVEGAAGGDRLFGGDGADTLKGQPQNDRLYGNAGTDRLIGGPGDDLLWGLLGLVGCDPPIYVDYLVFFNCSSGPNATTTKLLDWSIEPQVIDTSQEDVPMEAKLTLRDDEGALPDSVSVTYDNPASPTEFLFMPMFRVSGDGTESTYNINFPFPRGSATGNWSVAMVVYLTNGKSTGFGPQQLAEKGFPTAVTQTGPADLEPPRISDVSISPTRIDTSADQQSVHFRARVTDDFGIPRYGAYSPGAQAELNLNGASTTMPLTRVSGDDYDAIYEGDVTLPAGAPLGRYRAGIYATDGARNGSGFSGDELAALGIPGWIQNGP